MIDNHLHTRLCKHAEGEVYQFVEAAIAKGIQEIAFTDHNPLPDNFDIAHRMSFSEMDIYAGWIRNVQERYPEINIRFGIEADYYEGMENEVERLAGMYDFDLIIMSVHFIRHWPADNWVFDYHFPEKDIREVYTDYLATVKKGILSGLFDVVGHVDMIKRPGDSLIQLVPDAVLELLTAVKEKRMTLEINTSGYRKKAAESYPGLDWLPLLKSMDIPVTVGSDGHKPEQVGLQFAAVYPRIRAAEIDKLVRFRGRKPDPFPL